MHKNTPTRDQLWCGGWMATVWCVCSTQDGTLRSIIPCCGRKPLSHHFGTVGSLAASAYYLSDDYCFDSRFLDPQPIGFYRLLMWIFSHQYICVWRSFTNSRHVTQISLWSWLQEAPHIRMCEVHRSYGSVFNLQTGFMRFHCCDLRDSFLFFPNPCAAL